MASGAASFTLKLPWATFSMTQASERGGSGESDKH